MSDRRLPSFWSASYLNRFDTFRYSIFWPFRFYYIRRGKTCGRLRAPGALQLTEHKAVTDGFPRTHPKPFYRKDVLGGRGGLALRVLIVFLRVGLLGVGLGRVFRRPIGHHGGAHDAVEPGEGFVQVSLALAGDRALVRLFAVARINLVDHFHSLG